MTEYETHEFDVIVVGAGGAGLRAAIEARSTGLQHRAGLQVAAGQGPHRDGRGRRGRRPRQRLCRGQLAGPFPRHHARRQDAQQLAHGPAPRPGVARPGPRARGLGSPVRPDQGRPHPPARLRRPPLRPPGPRRRPDRPRADPDPAAEGRGRRHRGVHGGEGAPPPHDADGAGVRPGRLLAADRRVRGVQGQSRGHGHRRGGQELDVHLQLVGVDRRRTRHVAVGRGRPHRHGVRPVPPDRDGLAAVGPRASWSPRASAATAGCCATPRASGSCSTTSHRCSPPRRPTRRRRATNGTTTTPPAGDLRSCSPATRWPAPSTAR